MQRYVERTGIRVMCMDIVKFTAMARNEQMEAVKLITRAISHVVRRVLGKRRAAGYCFWSTGDGYIVCLYDQFPLGAALDIACGVQRYLRNKRTKFYLRYGLNEGPGILVKDAGGVVANVLGFCVNNAVRVMELGDENHILFTDTYKPHIDHHPESCIHTYLDVRLSKHKKVSQSVYSFYSDCIGNERTPYRILTGYRGVDHVIDHILDIIGSRMTDLIRDFIRKKTRRHKVADPKVRVTVLSFNRKDDQVWVTPHSRCNGQRARVREHIFPVSEGLFQDVLKSTSRSPQMRMILGLPRSSADLEGYRRALCRKGNFKKKTVEAFSGRSRAFLYLPLLHEDRAEGIICIDTTSPICESEQDFERVGDSLLQCVDPSLMRILGHIYQG